MGDIHFILFIVIGAAVIYLVSLYGYRFYHYMLQRGISRGEKVLLYFTILILVILYFTQK